MLDFLATLPGLLASCGVGVVGYIYKKEVQRTDALEQQIKETVTEAQVRQVIADKIDPLKEDLQDIKKTLDHIMFNQRKNH